MKLIWLLTSFHGRIGRAQFWFGTLLAAPVVAAGSALTNWLLRGDWTPGLWWSTDIADLVTDVVMITLLINIAVSAKRLHDRDLSGWWHLIILLPIIGTIWWLVEAGFRQGTRGRNQYGSDPRESGHERPAP